MILLSSIVFLTVGTMYVLDVHNIIYQTCKKKYTKFRNLNNLVSTRYKNGFSIFFISVKMVCQASWYSFLQVINNSVEKLDKGKYRVNYVVDGKLYKMVVKSRRGPSSVLLVCDENGEDVNSVVIPYLGPGENFHGSSLTPKFFGKKSLTFEMFDTMSLTFNENDKIRLT